MSNPLYNLYASGAQRSTQGQYGLTGTQAGMDPLGDSSHLGSGSGLGSMSSGPSTNPEGMISSIHPQTMSHGQGQSRSAHTADMTSAIDMHITAARKEVRRLSQIMQQKQQQHATDWDPRLTKNPREEMPSLGAGLSSYPLSSSPTLFGHSVGHSDKQSSGGSSMDKLSSYQTPSAASSSNVYSKLSSYQTPSAASSSNVYSKLSSYQTPSAASSSNIYSKLSSYQTPSAASSSNIYSTSSMAQNVPLSHSSQSSNVFQNMPLSYSSQSSKSFHTSSYTAAAGGGGGSSSYTSSTQGGAISSIPGLGDYSLSDQPSSSSTNTNQPKYTLESAMNILAKFGLENEDLELLTDYPDSELTPENLPFILRDIRLQKSKRATSSSGSDVDHLPQTSRGVSGSDHFGASGVGLRRPEDSTPIPHQPNRVLEYGHSSKYAGGFGDEIGGGSSSLGSSGGGNESMSMMDSYSSSSHGRDPPPNDFGTVKYSGTGSSPDQISSVSGSSTSCGSILSSVTPLSLDRPKRSQRPEQTSQSTQSPIQSQVYLLKKDKDDPVLKAKSPKSVLVKKPGADGQGSMTTPPPLPTLVRGVNPNQPSLGEENTGTQSKAKDSEQGVTGQGQIVGPQGALQTNKPQKPMWPPPLSTMNKDVPPPPFHIPGLPDMPSGPIMFSLNPGQNPLMRPPLLPRMMAPPPSLNLPAATTVAKRLPTPEMMSDYSATTPRIFPHTCSLCNVECKQIKDWISHQNTSFHIDNCRLLCNKYPDWQTDTAPAASPVSREVQLSPSSQSSKHHRQATRGSHSRSGSRSWSRSPSPRRYSRPLAPIPRSYTWSRSPSPRRYTWSRSPSPRRYSRPLSPSPRRYTRSRSPSPRRYTWSRSPSPRRHHGNAPSGWSRETHRARSPSPRSSRHTHRSFPRSPRHSPRRSHRRSPSPSSAASSHRRQSSAKSSRRQQREKQRESIAERRSTPKSSRRQQREKRRESIAERRTSSEFSRRQQREKRRESSAERRSSPEFSRRQQKEEQRESSAERRSSPEFSRRQQKEEQRESSAEKLAKRKLESSDLSSLEAMVPTLLAELAKMKSSSSSSSKGAKRSSSPPFKRLKRTSSPSSSSSSRKMKSIISLLETKSGSGTSKTTSTSSSKAQFGKRSKTTLTLKGVPSYIPYKELVAAVERFGKSNLVIHLKTTKEVLVCFEKEEDAEALANCKNFTIRCIPISITEKGDLFEELKNLSEKKPMTSSTSKSTKKIHLTSLKPPSITSVKKHLLPRPLNVAKKALLPMESLKGTKAKTAGTKQTPQQDTTVVKVAAKKPAAKGSVSKAKTKGKIVKKPKQSKTNSQESAAEPKVSEETAMIAKTIKIEVAETAASKKSKDKPDDSSFTPTLVSSINNVPGLETTAVLKELGPMETETVPKEEPKDIEITPETPANKSSDGQPKPDYSQPQISENQPKLKDMPHNSSDLTPIPNDASSTPPPKDSEATPKTENKPLSLETAVQASAPTASQPDLSKLESIVKGLETTWRSLQTLPNVTMAQPKAALKDSTTPPKEGTTPGSATDAESADGFFVGEYFTSTTATAGEKQAVVAAPETELQVETTPTKDGVQPMRLRCPKSFRGNSFSLEQLKQIQHLFKQDEKVVALITGLPKWSKYFYTPNIIKLLEPYGYLNTKDSLYILLEQPWAFAVMPSWDNVLKMVQGYGYKYPKLKQSKLVFHIVMEHLDLTQDQAYASLMWFSNKPCVDSATLKERLVLFNSVWESNMKAIWTIRLAVSSQANIKNHLSLTNKLYVEFESPEDVERVVNWFKTSKHKDQYIVHTFKPQGQTPGITPEGPLDGNQAAVAMVTSSALNVPGVVAPFWTTTSKYPFCRRISCPQFKVPSYLTAKGLEPTEIITRYIHGSAPLGKVAMVTGLPEGGCNVEDITALALPWGYVPGRWNVFVLPFQRRAFVRFPRWYQCCDFILANTDKPVSMNGCELTFHFVTEDVLTGHGNEEDKFYKSLMNLSNTAIHEFNLSPRLMIVDLKTWNPEIIRMLINIVMTLSADPIYNYLPLADRVYLEMRSQGVANILYDKYNDGVLNRFDDAVIQLNLGNRSFLLEQIGKIQSVKMLKKSTREGEAVAKPFLPSPSRELYKMLMSSLEPAKPLTFMTSTPQHPSTADCSSGGGSDAPTEEAESGTEEEVRKGTKDGTNEGEDEGEKMTGKDGQKLTQEGAALHEEDGGMKEGEEEENAKDEDELETTSKSITSASKSPAKRSKPVQSTTQRRTTRSSATVTSTDTTSETTAIEEVTDGTATSQPMEEFCTEQGNVAAPITEGVVATSDHKVSAESDTEMETSVTQPQVAEKEGVEGANQTQRDSPPQGKDGQSDASPSLEPGATEDNLKTDLKNNTEDDDKKPADDEDQEENYEILVSQDDQEGTATEDNLENKVPKEDALQVTDSAEDKIANEKERKDAVGNQDDQILEEESFQILDLVDDEATMEDDRQKLTSTQVPETPSGQFVEKEDSRIQEEDTYQIVDSVEDQPATEDCEEGKEEKTLKKGVKATKNSDITTWESKNENKETPERDDKTSREENNVNKTTRDTVTGASEREVEGDAFEIVDSVEDEPINDDLTTVKEAPKKERTPKKDDRVVKKERTTRKSNTPIKDSEGGRRERTQRKDERTTKINDKPVRMMTRASKKEEGTSSREADCVDDRPTTEHPERRKKDNTTKKPTKKGKATKEPSKTEEEEETMYEMVDSMEDEPIKDNRTATKDEKPSKKKDSETGERTPRKEDRIGRKYDKMSTRSSTVIEAPTEEEADAYQIVDSLKDQPIDDDLTTTKEREMKGRAPKTEDEAAMTEDKPPKKNDTPTSDSESGKREKTPQKEERMAQRDDKPTRKSRTTTEVLEEVENSYQILDSVEDEPVNDSLTTAGGSDSQKKERMPTNEGRIPPSEEEEATYQIATEGSDGGKKERTAKKDNKTSKKDEKPIKSRDTTTGASEKENKDSTAKRDDKPSKKEDTPTKKSNSPAEESENEEKDNMTKEEDKTSKEEAKQTNKSALVTLDEVREEEEDYPDDTEEEEELRKRQATVKEKQLVKERENKRSKEREELEKERSSGSNSSRRVRGVRRRGKERGRDKEEEKVGLEGMVTLDEVGADEPSREVDDEGGVERSGRTDGGMMEGDLQALVTLDEIVEEEEEAGPSTTEPLPLSQDDESGDAFNPETLDEAGGDEEEAKGERSKKMSSTKSKLSTEHTVDEVGEEVVMTRRGGRPKKRGRRTPVRKSTRGKRRTTKEEEEEPPTETISPTEQAPPTEQQAPPTEQEAPPTGQAPLSNTSSSLVKDPSASLIDNQPDLQIKEAEVGEKQPSIDASSTGQDQHPQPPENQTPDGGMETEDNAEARAALKDDSKQRREMVESEAKRSRSQSPTVPADFKMPPFRPDEPIGLEFMVPKTAFFCKLCSFFCENESSAKNLHCGSQRHYQNMEKHYQKLQEQTGSSSQGSASK